MPPDRYFVAIPFGHAAARLQWSDDGSRVVIRKLLDDVRFLKTVFDIAILSKRRGEIPPSLFSSSTQVWRIRRHDLRKIRSERKDLILPLDRFHSVLRQVFGFLRQRSQRRPPGRKVLRATDRSSG